MSKRRLTVPLQKEPRKLIGKEGRMAERHPKNYLGFTLISARFKNGVNVDGMKIPWTQKTPLKWRRRIKEIKP